MRSDAVKKGIAQAPQRSLMRALGLTEEEMKKPLVGIVSSYNEIVPGHMNLDKITEAVKMGVAMAGGTPIPPSVWQWHISLMPWYVSRTVIKTYLVF